MIAAIREVIDSCGLKSSTPRSKTSPPNLTIPFEPHVETDLLSAGLLVDSAGSFDYLETPRSFPGQGPAVASNEETALESRHLPTEYKGFAGEFHLRTQYRSTPSNVSQVSEPEQTKMAATFGTIPSVPSVPSKSSETGAFARNDFGYDSSKPSTRSDVAIRVDVKPVSPGAGSSHCCCQCGAKFEKVIYIYFSKRYIILVNV